MLELDWASLFSLSVPPLELIIRGSAIYWFLFLLFRFIMRRDIGSIAIADILLLVIIADAAQNAMAGEYKSITDGIILIGTIAGWNLLLNWLTYRFPKLMRHVAPEPLCLVKNGKIIRHNLRKELLTEEEIMSKIREQGIEDLAKVKYLYMENDGAISIIKKE